MLFSVAASSPLAETQAASRKDTFGCRPCHWAVFRAPAVAASAVAAIAGLRANALWLVTPVIVSGVHCALSRSFSVTLSIPRASPLFPALQSVLEESRGW